MGIISYRHIYFYSVFTFLLRLTPDWLYIIKLPCIGSFFVSGHYCINVPLKKQVCKKHKQTGSLLTHAFLYLPIFFYCSSFSAAYARPASARPAALQASSVSAPGAPLTVIPSPFTTVAPAPATRSSQSRIHSWLPQP